MASRFHVPQPDYDFTIRQKSRNPYIPTPDYTTLHYNKQRERPSLNMIGTEFYNNDNDGYMETYVRRDEYIEPPVPQLVRIYNTPIEKPHRPEKKTPRLSNAPANNFMEIKKHSYMEDREVDEPDHHRSTQETKEHIKHIGVPVLPGIVASVTPTFELAGPVSSEQNKAFLRHLENHKKFDTVRGDRGIEECDICQIMKKQLEAENMGHQSWDGQYVNSPKATPKHHSTPGSRNKRADVRDLFPQVQNEQQPEPLPYFQPVIARSRQNYERKREEEISITAMEPIEILNIQKGYSLCRKGDNTIGWVPSTVFDI